MGGGRGQSTSTVAEQQALGRFRRTPRYHYIKAPDSGRMAKSICAPLLHDARIYMGRG